MVGADFSNSAVGHWACPQTDVVVAKVDGKWLLHELTLDVVVSNSTTLSSGDVGFQFPIGEAQFAYDVPQDPTKPLGVTIGKSAVACPTAPMPHWIK